MALTLTTQSNYWISPNALNITPNALDIPDYIQASCVSGAEILVFVKGIIDYDAGHNYRHWRLTASPTVFNSHTEKYVYAAIPRASVSSNDVMNTSAQVVFPSELLDIYGKNTQGEQIGSVDFYYIFLYGAFTSSGDNGTTPRRWMEGYPLESGFLDTNLAYDAGPVDTEWYRYNNVSKLVTFLTDLTMTADKIFQRLYAQTIEIVSGGKIQFKAGGSVNKVATLGDLTDDTATEIVTPHYLHDREAEVEKKYLRKDQTDETKFELTVASLRSNGTADIFGNFTAEKNATVLGKFVAESTSQFKEASTWGTFNKDLITGTGAQIDKDGNAVFDSVGVRKYLEAAELRLRRTRIYSGVEWHTVGRGEIESVQRLGTTRGVITLKLEQGERGEIAVGDKCMGIFHNESGNASANADDRHGNIQFAGFSTSYFMVTQILEDDCSRFVYELRPPSPTWTRMIHPSPKMAFAAYANAVDPDRRTCRLSTTEYEVWLENMTNWEFAPENYFLISGNLEGFSILAVNQAGTPYSKALHGKGTALGNVYMFGTIDQFNRLADHIALTVAPLINNDFTIDTAETMRITPRMLSFDNTERTDAEFYVMRNSGDTTADVAWNDERGHDFADDGAFELTLSDLNGQDVAEFVFFGSRNIEGSVTPYVVSYDATVRRRGALKGDDALNVVLSTDTVIIPTINGDVSDRTTRRITATVYSGTTPLTPVSIASSITADDGFEIQVANANTIVVVPYPGSPMTNAVTNLTVVASLNGVNHTLTKDLAVLGLAQGQSVTGPTGASVSRIAKTYKATADNTPPSADASDWQSALIEPTSALPYVWCREITYVTGGDYGETEYPISTTVSLLLKQGSQGYEGCIIRKSEWERGKQYRNDSALTPAQVATMYGGNPTRYIDEVTVSNYNGNDGYTYLCQRTHTSIAANKPIEGASTAQWQLLNALAPVRTPFADIDRALIQYLQVQQIALQHQSDAPDGSYHKGDIYGAIGGSDAYPLWFGGLTVEQANAKIGSDGSVYFNNGTFQGSIRARNFSQDLTECVAEEYFGIPRLQNFIYDPDRHITVHDIGELAGSYFSACVIDLFKPERRTGFVSHWIVLPAPTAALVGKVFEFIVPNFAAQGSIAGTGDIYNQAIGITSYNGETSSAGLAEFVDSARADIEAQNGAFVTLWSRYAHFAHTPAYTAAVLCAKRYVTDEIEDGNVARLRLVCVARTVAATTYYHWAILEAHNTLLITGDQYAQIDVV